MSSICKEVHVCICTVVHVRYLWFKLINLNNSFYTFSLLIYYLVQVIFKMHVHTHLYFGFYSYQTREHAVLKKNYQTYSCAALVKTPFLLLKYAGIYSIWKRTVIFFK